MLFIKIDAIIFDEKKLYSKLIVQFSSRCHIPTPKNGRLIFKYLLYGIPEKQAITKPRFK